MKGIAAGLGFIARRLAEAMLVMLAILVIAFAVRASLGDPLREIVGEAVPQEQREALRHQLGLDAPWPVQLARYLGGALHGDLGTSTIYKRPTLDVVLAKFPGKLRARARREPDRAAARGPARHLLRRSPACDSGEAHPRA